MTQLSTKRDLGAFYTPARLSDILCQWAVRHPGETVLEPSFGGCGFLGSAKAMFETLGQNRPLPQLFGCDIDPNAFGHLQPLFGQPVDADRFHLGDFLLFEPHASWPTEFDVVIGNPPYLPYRRIDPEARRYARLGLTEMGLELDLRASLWAYFVALGCRYLKVGGRMAWVLPSSFLHANYATNLRSFVARHFERVQAFELEERLFLSDGTEERSIILLAEGMIESGVEKTASPEDIPLTSCAQLRDLPDALDLWSQSTLETARRCGSSVKDGLETNESRLLAELRDQNASAQLGEFVDIRIGLVTGNNRFFVLSRADAEANGLGSQTLTPILSKFRHAPGLDITLDEHRSTLQSGVRGLLVSCEDTTEAPLALQAYLKRYDSAEREACRTFQKRKHWYQPDDGNPPDAFFPVMHHDGPRLVLNPDGIQCTNTVHRTYFKSGLSAAHKRLIGLSLLSSFSQLSAEIEGRSYGAGVLKHEPREAEKIELLVPKIHGNRLRATYRRVDDHLRCGAIEKARREVDALLLGALGRADPKKDAECLNAALLAVRAARHR